MTDEIGTLREEYESLRGRVEMLRTVADTVDSAPLDSLLRGVEAAYRVLVEDILPLCRAEHRAQYPVVTRVLGTAEAAATMDHELDRLVELSDELRGTALRLVDSPSREREAPRLRAILYGLYELVGNHLNKEERIFLPLLHARLTPDEAYRLVTDMYLAEEGARR